jgi:hypothetical protein
MPSRQPSKENRMTRQINKNAQVLSDIPELTPSETKMPDLVDPPTVPVQPRAEQEPAGLTYSKPVQQMQEAMSSLYDTITHYSVFGDITNQGTSAPFITTLLNRYMDKHSDNKKTLNLAALAKTFQNFAKGSNRPDGKWGPYTNVALNNIYSLVHAIYNAAQQLGIQQSDYSDKNLQELRASIPTNLKSLQGGLQTDKIAQVITKNLATAKKLIGSFMNAVKNDPHLSQGQQFKTNYSTHKPTLNVSESQAPVFNISLPVDISKPGEGTIMLPLGALADKDSFYKFVEKHNIQVDGRAPSSTVDMTKILEYIENQVKSVDINKFVKPIETQSPYQTK